MYHLPQELINLIYEYDGTKREHYDIVLDELSTYISKSNIYFNDSFEYFKLKDREKFSKVILQISNLT